MSNIFFFKPNREFQIISLSMILFSIFILLISYIAFGVIIFLEFNKFIVIHVVTFTILTLGIIILIGFFIEKKNRVEVSEGKIYVISGLNRESYSIDINDIREIIYCKTAKSASYYWNSIDKFNRPYGFFMNDQIIISVKNRPVIQHVKVEDPSFVLLFLKRPKGFLNYMKIFNIDVKNIN